MYKEVTLLPVLEPAKKNHASITHNRRQFDPDALQDLSKL